MLKLDKSEIRQYNGKPTEFRIYVNSVKGDTLTTYFLRKDKFGHTWWAFEDIFQFPEMRQVAAKRITDLYGQGLSLIDITTITGQMKAVLKGNGADKYEKAYAKVLELENLTENIADPIKQNMGLCTVYLLMDDENPEIFSIKESNLKMAVLAEDPEGMAFFLEWWIALMKRYGTALNKLSKIALIASQVQTEASLS